MTESLQFAQRGPRADAEENAEFWRRLSERLRITRQVVEDTQSEVSRRVGVHPVIWGRYEKGTRAIDTVTMVRFCVEYNVCPRWLLLGDMVSLAEHNPKVALSVSHLFKEAAEYLPPPGPPKSRRSAALASAESRREQSDSSAPAPAPRRKARSRAPA